MPNNANLMTIDEVAEYLKFKPRTINDWVQKNLIPHYRLGRKTIRFDIETIDEWLETKRPKVNENTDWYNG